MKTLRGNWQRGLVLGVMGFLLWGVAHAAQSGGDNRPAEKDVQKAAVDMAPKMGADVRMPVLDHDSLGAPGVVEPLDREVRVAPQVAGVVDQVFVREGQQVKQGAALVQLYAATEQAALLAAQADVQVAQANLDKTVHGARVEDLDAALADADAAAARAHSSTDTLQRTEKLFGRNAVTEDEVTRARFTATADARSAAALQARYKALANGSRVEDVASARAAVAQAQGRLAQAKASLERLTVVAPADGEVLQLLVRPGEYINPAAGAAITLGDTRTLRARLDVDERDVARLAIGQAGYVQAEGYGATQFTGKVVEMGRRMGRKNVRTDEPTERLDTKILEVVLQLDGHPSLPQGLRVTGFVQKATGNRE